MEKETLEPYLAPTAVIQSDDPKIISLMREIVGDAKTDKDAAIRMYYYVRDAIRYDPYSHFYKPEHYTPSFVINRGRGFCISKAALLTALCRAAGIPTRIGFADVKNHLATENLLKELGTDRFIYHGFTEIYLNGKWIKATPTFNKELCELHNAAPLAFDGENDAVFQSFNRDNEQYMEYIAYHDVYADVPVDKIVAAWREGYGNERVDAWIRRLESKEKRPLFEEEVPAAHDNG